MSSSGWMCGISTACLVAAAFLGAMGGGAAAAGAQQPAPTAAPAPVEEMTLQIDQGISRGPEAEEDEEEQGEEEEREASSQAGAAEGTAPAAAGKLVSTVPNPALPPSSLPIAENAIQLSLDDAVAVALQRNLNLLIQRFGREQFRLGIAEQLGIYDLGLDGQAFISEDTEAQTSTLSGALVQTTKLRYGRFTLGQLVPTGGVASATLDMLRFESNNTFLVVNPSYESNFDLRFTQPLLRDFGQTWTERNIKIAQINHDTNREDFELQVTATLQQVEVAYWNLVQARKDVEVARESLALAQDLHRMNRVRVDVGTLAPLELVQSEVGIATRQETIILAEATAQVAEDELRRLLHLEEGQLWDLPIVPTTSAEAPGIEIDLDEAIATALKERPEVRAQQLVLDRRELDVKLARNQMLPTLDLLTTYGYNGTAGVIRSDDGQVINDGGPSDSFRQLRDHNFEGWRVELQFGFPLQNKSARAAKAIADVNFERGETEMEDLQEAVRTEVRQAVRAVRTALQTIESAGASVRLAEQNLDAERKRYENGLSTSFQVLEIQEDLTSARSRQVRAVASYRRALAEYHRATGRLTEAEGVELEDPLRVDHLNRFGWGIGERSGK